MTFATLAQEIDSNSFNEFEAGTIDSLTNGEVEVLVQCRKYEREENRAVRKALTKFEDWDHDCSRPILKRTFKSAVQARKYLKANRELFGALTAADDAGTHYAYADSGLRWNFFVGWINQVAA